jgi:sulfite reductase (NADPH) flavoprotein alpha-component
MIEALDPETRRYAAAGAVTLAWLGFCGLIAGREALRGRAKRREAAALLSGAGEPVLVAFASQTGFAEELAKATAKALTAGGAPVTLRELSAVTAADLAAAGRALFVVSTTGEGDAPDPARAFIRDVMSAEPELPTLRYGVLALGDTEYANYCAFGRALDAWLAKRGAAPLLDRVEVDDGDEAALRHWQSQLARLTGAADAPDWSRPSYDRWTLADRRLLNPGSPGGEAWHIRLEPVAHTASWEAGDIIEIGPRNDPAEVSALIARRGAVQPTSAARARRRRGLGRPERDGGAGAADRPAAPRIFDRLAARRRRRRADRPPDAARRWQARPRLGLAVSIRR